MKMKLIKMKMNIEEYVKRAKCANVQIFLKIQKNVENLMNFFCKNYIFKKCGGAITKIFYFIV
jgi:hypothetical protein